MLGGRAVDAGRAVGLALGDVGLGPGDGAAADGVDGDRVVEAVVVGEVPAAAVRAQASDTRSPCCVTSTVLVRFSAVPPWGTRQRSLLAWAGPATRSRDTTVRARAASLCMSIQPIRRGRSYAPAMTAFRTCPLCEATCGLAIERRRRRRWSASAATPRTCSRTASSAPRASRSSTCTRTPTGCARRWSGATASWPRRWDEAFAVIDARLGRGARGRRPRRRRRLPGQPHRAHPRRLRSTAARCSRRCGTQATSTRRRPSTRCPSRSSAGLMFGGGLSDAGARPRPHRLPARCSGANPLASNGSLMTAPDMRGRLRAIRERGGTGRGRRPAALAHRRGGRRAPVHPPGHRRAAAVRAACTCCSPRAWSTRPVDRAVAGVDEVRGAGRRLRPRGGRAARPASPAATIERMARELAAAPRAAVYGRIGTCTAGVRDAGLWLVDVLNALTGNLDRAGGAMFPRAAAGASQHAGAGRARAAASRLGRWHSRVRGRARGASASCRSPCWPRRSRRRARARSAR